MPIFFFCPDPPPEAECQLNQRGPIPPRPPPCVPGFRTDRGGGDPPKGSPKFYLQALRTDSFCHQKNENGKSPQGLPIAQNIDFYCYFTPCCFAFSQTQQKFLNPILAQLVLGRGGFSCILHEAEKSVFSCCCQCLGGGAEVDLTGRDSSGCFCRHLLYAHLVTNPKDFEQRKAQENVFASGQPAPSDAPCHICPKQCFTGIPWLQRKRKPQNNPPFAMGFHSPNHPAGTAALEFYDTGATPSVSFPSSPLIFVAPITRLAVASRLCSCLLPPMFLSLAWQNCHPPPQSEIFLRFGFFGVHLPYPFV